MTRTEPCKQQKLISNSPLSSKSTLQVESSDQGNTKSIHASNESRKENLQPKSWSQFLQCPSPMDTRSLRGIAATTNVDISVAWKSSIGRRVCS